MRRHPLSALLLTIATLLAVTACSPASDSGPEQSDATAAPAPRWGLDRLTTVADPAWVVETTPIGDAPTIVGETVVAYVTEGGNPFTLIGLDAATGERKWSWVTSVQDLYWSLEVRAVDDGSGGALIASTSSPIMDEDTGVWSLPLMLLDAETGTPVASVDDMWIQSFYDCGLTAGICFWGYHGSDAEASEHYALRSDGSVGLFASVIDGYEASAYVADNLYVVRDASGSDALVRIDGSDIQWSVPAADLARTELNLMESVSGWTVVRDEGVLLYELTTITHEPTYRITASQVQVGAVDIESGEVLWTRDGAMRCWVADHHDPVLCRGNIGHERTEDQDQPEIFVSGDVTALGVDLRTGEERFTRTLPDVTGFVSGRRGGAYATFGSLWPIETTDGLQVYDTVKDELHPLQDEAMVGCTQTVTVATPRWSVPGAEPITVETGAVFQGCTAGDAVSDAAALSHAVVLNDFTREWSAAGEPVPAETEERLRVVQLEHALAGYRL